MKQLFFFFIALAISTGIYAQASITMVEYQKVNRQGVVADMPFTEKAVSKALQDKLEKMGYSGKESKGFTVYKGVRLKELGDESYDLYFMVDRKSRKDKDNSTVTLLISSGYDKFITESENSTLFSNAKAYLVNLRDVVADYDLEEQITEQEKMVKTSEKKATDLTDDAAALQKKKKKLEEDIDDNTKSQAKQKDEIEKQKQILETLKGKRRA